MTVEHQVEHDRAGHRFLVRHAGDDVSELTYAPVGSDILDLQHTGVARSMRGQGVGEALVQAALDFAREERQKIIPSCRFVATWIRAHPDEQDLVAP